MEQQRASCNIILRRATRGAVIAVLVALALNGCADYLSAGGDSVNEKIITATEENAAAWTDTYVALDGILKAVTATRKTLNDEAAWKHKNYTADHSSLFDIKVPVIVGPAKIFSDNLTPHVNHAVNSDKTLGPLIDRFAPGSRTISNPVRFSDIYETRVGAWRDYARNVLSADNFAARDIVDSQGIISDLNKASYAAGDSYLILNGGYAQLEQAGGQISNFLSQELSKLRVDVNRQIEAKAGFALNEQQERADMVMAFEQAVKTWADPNPENSGY
ncbi:hypothetical protein FACS1894204_04410 [Synergistales bacterium]|nr:hypothetical protein FACS1894204_04410 [Synergistales bacterium]